MQVNALASGSSGNAYLVRSGSTAVLVEAGLPASKVSGFLTSLGIDPRLLQAILLTHAHSDHVSGAREFSDRFGVPVIATAGTLGHGTLRDSAHARELQPGSTCEIGELECLAFSVPHDCVQPVGFRISSGEATVCIATDLGFVPDGIRPQLQRADLLILEANHDEEMLWSGPYPSFLKRRVGGDCGHLSNNAAARCVVELGCRPPREVWLAHLSLVNNRVGRALDVVRDALAQAGLGHIGVHAAGRNRPSLAWRSTPTAKQLALF